MTLKNSPTDELPIIDTFGITKVSKGYVAVRCMVQGAIVLEHEALSPEPESREGAVNRLKVRIGKSLMNLAKKASA